MFLIARSSLPFLLSLFVSETLVLLRCSKRERFYVRVICSAVVLFLLVFALSLLMDIIRKYTANGPAFWDVLFEFAFIVIVFALTVAYAMICWDISLRESLFYCIAGYSVEHFCNSILAIILYVLSVNSINIPSDYMLWFINILAKNCIVVLFYFFVFSPIFKNSNSDVENLRVLSVSGINLIICIFLSIIKGYGAGSPTNAFTVRIVCNVYAMLGCLLCLLLQGGVLRERWLALSNKELDSMLKQQEKKYALQKDLIDLVNMKFHDLKYSTSSENSDTKRVGVFSLYDSIVETGSPALDLIILNFYPVCENEGIVFTYMADGNALEFMESGDITALFGNLVENAVDAAQKEEREKRIIGLKAYTEKSMLIVQIWNHCSKAPKFDDGFPLSDKGDNRYHGFGVRSIQYLVKKYQGRVKMSWEDEIFTVNIMIPIKEA